ncbi:MAG: regulatory iron-sulfur-containing complex subunit RicT [Phycisphaerae bacterium]|nr:regulatory iron-sulfur-containing complex subunit RicT [Phycisphaerae bacterium]
MSDDSRPSPDTFADSSPAQEPPSKEPLSPAAAKPPRGAAGPTLVARYSLMRQLSEFRHTFEKSPPPGTKVVLRSERGVELGEVVAGVSTDTRPGCISPEQIERYIQANGPEYPFRRDGKVMRIANPQDLVDFRHLESSAREERTYCTQQIKELGLKMKLVTVEHLLGGELIIFYFLAEQRVDFRKLVRNLANQYHTRIEMRQVGARDEARLVADYERCGQRCCCQEFLKNLKPVSMRMAKTQKATLDPSKISGRCGRLMCCLCYEDATYHELKAKLPYKNIWVRTPELVGCVTGTQILTQLVELRLPNHSRVVVPNEDIIERDVEPPAGDEAQQNLPAKVVTTAPRRKPAAKRPREVQESPHDQEQVLHQAQVAQEPVEAQEPALAEVRLDPAWTELLGDKIDIDEPRTPEPKSDLQATEPTSSEADAPAIPMSTVIQEPSADQPAKKRRRRRHRKTPGPGISPQPSQGHPEAPTTSATGSQKRRRRRKKKKRPRHD